MKHLYFDYRNTLHQEEIYGDINSISWRQKTSHELIASNSGEKTYQFYSSVLSALDRRIPPHADDDSLVRRLDRLRLSGPVQSTLVMGIFSRPFAVRATWPRMEC